MKLHTQRLTLRPMEFTDWDFILQLVNQPSWLRYIGDRNVKDEQTAKKYLEDGVMLHQKEHGYSFLALELNANEKVIGICGLVNRPGMQHPDLGFALLDEFTGQGYVREACEIVLDVIPKVFKLSVIDAITTQDNSNSIRVLQQLQFEEIGTIVLQNESEELIHWRLHLG